MEPSGSERTLQRVGRGLRRRCAAGGRSSGSTLRVRCRNSGRRADQGEMAERLWEVADLSLPSHVVLFGQQAEIVGQTDEPLEQGTSLLDTAVERERADQPKRAGKELSLVAGQPVVRVGGRVARDEAVSAEVARDRVDRAGDPLVGAGKEPHERDGEDTRVELLGSIVLGEGAPLAVVALLADLPVDLVAGLLPAVQRRFQTELLAESNRPVEHDPGHDLGVREVATRSAGLPDAVVGLTPDRLDVVDDSAPTRPESLLDPANDRRADECDSEDLAVDVELELFGSGVADADRFRALVPGELLQLELGEAPLAADSVHDLDLCRVARADPKEVVAEAERLLGVAAGEQRLQCEH